MRHKNAYNIESSYILIGIIMPVSTRIIRVLDGQYTLELELEVDSPDDLLSELCKTDWGKKIAYLLSKMLPEVPEIQTEDQKAMAEAEAKRIAEAEENLREEGRREIRAKYYHIEYSDIQKRAREEAEEKMRKKYMDYIRKKILKKNTKTKEEKTNSGNESCFGNYEPTHPRCYVCASKAECEKETKQEESAGNDVGGQF